MFKKLLTLLVYAFLFSGSLFAQATISGTVTDSETGETLPGVNILVTELQRGAASDAEGDYSITGVPPGTYTIRATFVGYNTYTATLQVGNQDVEFDIGLESSVFGLDDVVVTAFGIERDRRALGYGVAEVTSESIEKRSDTDIARSLTGQLPGVKIQSSGGLTGSGTEITIRGFSSLSGSNSPLWIVDGVQFDSGQNSDGGSEWAFGGSNNTSPNRFLDLDPNNIADITVLKGLSATVLYGEQGSNGVILVTTKSGSFKGGGQAQPGFDVTINQSVYATQISSRPDYQNTYGGGFDQNFGWFFSNWGPRFSTTDSTLFGSDFIGFDDDGTILIEHPLLQNAEQAAAFPDLVGVGYRYEAKPDPIEDFFQTGLASTTSLNIAGGTQDVRLNVSYSRSGEEGFTPNNELTRDAFSVGVNYKISEILSSQTTFNMSLTDVQAPPTSAGGGSGPAAAGGSTSVFGDVFYTPRSIDLSMPFTNPVTGGSSYYRADNGIPHPRWTANNVLTTSETSRYYGKTELNLNPIDGLNLIYRLGYDSYTENRSYSQNPGGVRPDALLQGFFQTIEARSTSWDHNVNALLSYQLTEDISYDATLGAQYVTENFERQGLESQQMIVFDFFEHSNFLSQSSTNFFSGGDFQSTVEQQTAGVFAEMTFGYQDFVYLNIAGRNDWFSTLEPENNTIFYPSASLSYIVSDHLDFNSDALTYLKLFAGLGSSASQPSPYSTRNTLGVNARAFSTRDGNIVTTNATSNFLGNPDLKPELQTEYEAGFDIRFLNDRVGLEASAYTRSTTDLITQAPIDPATGFTSTLVNIGEVQNQGLEVTLRAAPVRGDLQWDVVANFFTNESEVTELGAGLDRIQIGGGFTTRGNFAEVGQPYGVMYGSVIERVTQELKDADPNFANVAIGTPIISSTGNYIDAQDIDIIGDPNPDWDLSVSNTFSYKGASFSFQFDYQQGGDMFSVWNSTLMARGLTSDTDKVDRNNTFILPGVNEQGATNTVQISPSGVFFDNFGFGADEMRTYDMTHIRLANAALSYDLPPSILGNSPFKAITVSVTGDNLWMLAFNVPEASGFDPNVNSIGGNSRGFEYLTGPAARRFGGSIRVQF